MRASTSLFSSASHAVPRYRSSTLATRLPPPKLPLFRSVVAHPPAPYAAEAHGKAKDAAAKAAQGGADSASGAKQSRGKKTGPAGSAAPPRPLVGPHQLLYSTAPRPLIPLTASPTNHKLWNPPAPDSAQTRSIDKDESGRLARFAGRFGGSSALAAGTETAGAGASAKTPGEQTKEDGLFGMESDMSWLEGVTAQSPGTALGKRDVVGPAKKEKKGKK